MTDRPGPVPGLSRSGAKRAVEVSRSVLYSRGWCVDTSLGQLLGDRCHAIDRAARRAAAARIHIPRLVIAGAASAGALALALASAEAAKPTHRHAAPKPPQLFRSVGVARSLGRDQAGTVRVFITLARDPLVSAATSPTLRPALTGRLTDVDATSLRRHGSLAAGRIVQGDTQARNAAARRLQPALTETGALLTVLHRAVEKAGGRVVGVDYAGPGLVAVVPQNALDRLARRDDVAAISPAREPRPMGALANESAAVGASTWWSNGHLGGPGIADVAQTNLAVMDDKIQEDQPLFHGVRFVRPMDATVGTLCGQATAGCDRGTEVAGMAVAVGNSTCVDLCTADSGTEKGIAGRRWPRSRRGLPPCPTRMCADTTARYGRSASASRQSGDAGTRCQGQQILPTSTAIATGVTRPPRMQSSSEISTSSASTLRAIQTEPSGNDGLNGTGSGHITDSCIAYDVICAGRY